MRKEEVKKFLVETPFRIVTKKGTVRTCVDVLELNDFSISFRDRFGSTVTQELDDISTISTMGGE